MNSTSLLDRVLNRRIALSFLGIALLTTVCILLRPLTSFKAPAVVIVFGLAALFFIKGKVLDTRLAFALCGLGLALVFNTMDDSLAQIRKWQLTDLVIIVAYGFAALIVSEGFLKEFASTSAQFGFGTRSRLSALFLTLLITFLVNSIILSAGSTCALVAPIFVPLLVRLGFPAPVAAAAVVLGAWGGFVNPGDLGGGTIARELKANGLPDYSITINHIGPAILALAVSAITFAVLNRKESANSEPVVPASELRGNERRSLRGLIAILPFLFLVPVELVVRYLQLKVDVPSRLLIALGGASLAAFVVVLRETQQRRKKVPVIGKVFAAGLWKGFTEVVLLIIAAKLFIWPFRYLIITHSKEAIATAPIFALVSVPIAFLTSATIGSGDPIASALIPIVVEAARNSPHVAAIASILWLATEMGRNVSPISAATLTCAKAVSSEEIEGTTVSSYVLIPVLAGFVVGSIALYVVLS